MQTKVPRTINDWIVELDSDDPQRHTRALEALAVLAPSNKWAAAALQAAGVTDRQTLAEAAGRRAAPAASPERAQARRLYWVSLLLPLVALSTICVGPAVVVYPILLLVLVIMGLRSPAPFIFWHTNQWLLLTVPCALLFALAYVSDGELSLRVGGNLILGLLWYISMIAGLNQAGAGECWLWQRIDRRAELPRPWARASTAASPEVARTVADWLQQFRSGTVAEQQAALASLEALGEVEVF